MEDVTSLVIDDAVLGASDPNARDEAINSNINTIKTSQGLSGTGG